LGGEHPDLAVFPELFIPGYPPQDLLERAWFVEKTARALDDLLDISLRHPDIGILVGTISKSEQSVGKGLHNSAVLARCGKILATTHKSLLPTYDVFDEARYFDPAEETHVVPFGGEVLGVSVCEDAWGGSSRGHHTTYNRDPIAELAKQGATVLINLSASPFCVGKDEVRFRLFEEHAVRHDAPFVVVNQVGGNDELVFDGQSACVTPRGRLAAYLPAFEECVRVVNLAAPGAGTAFAPADPVESVRAALVTGLRDYAAKSGFESVALGLSGGIDSAVVCALAAEAVGPGNVFGVSMPSPYSSTGSIEDSRELAANLGVRFSVIPISDLYQSYLDELGPYLRVGDVDVTKENIQARIRGNILMAISNESGRLLLSTGNKSELAVGYCTLYGDMSGGLAVISDVPKTMVYSLARLINRGGDVIPNATLEKPASAELKPNQKDQDTLPPYETLDAILDLYIDRGLSRAEIVSEGFADETVSWVVRAVNRSEHKRRQSAPGLKVTTKAFGSGRRMPIAARYDS
jgi:NAD+ synthase (glutamine-hydrolysing)